MEMLLMFSGIFCGVIFFLGVMVVGIVFLVRWLGSSFRHSGGWDELAQRFPGPQSIQVKLEMGYVRLGSVYYRNSIQMGATSNGLYLVSSGFLKNPPLLIPWGELKNPRPTLLYLQGAHMMDIGEPSIAGLTVMDKQYQWMQAYIEGA